MSSTVVRMLARVLVLCAAAPVMAIAQQATTVSGRVVSEANTPVQGVSVSIPTLSVGGYTNEQGRYTFTVPAGRATGQVTAVTARRIGYTPISRNVTLTAGATVTQDFTLSTATTQLEAVVVTALGQERE